MSSGWADLCLHALVSGKLSGCEGYEIVDTVVFSQVGQGPVCLVGSSLVLLSFHVTCQNKVMQPCRAYFIGQQVLGSLGQEVLNVVVPNLKQVKTNK